MEPRDDFATFIHMLSNVFLDPAVIQKLLAGGFFYADLENGTGSTSHTLRRLGFTDRELRDDTYQKRIHPDDHNTYFALWERVQQGLEDELYVEYRVRDNEGIWHWIETRAVVVARRPDQSIAKIVGIDRIISARKEAEAFLERQIREMSQKIELAETLVRVGATVSTDDDMTRQLKRIIEKATTIVPFDRCDIYALEADQRERVISYTRSDEYKDALPPGCVDQCEELRDQTIPIIWDDFEINAVFRSCIGVPLKTDDGHVGEAMFWHHTEKRYRGIDVFPLMTVGSVLAVAIYNYRTYWNTVHDLETDELTGFLTRRSFDREAPRVWNEFVSAYRSNAVVMIDIDHFKRVNDTHGHATGDRVIREVTALIRGQLRKDDILGRYGGEEFAAILPNADAKSARRTMERIRTTCEALHLDDKIGPTTISVGGSICDDGISDTVTLEEHLARADQALYDAKNTGRNRVVFAE